MQKAESTPNEEKLDSGQAPRGKRAGLLASLVSIVALGAVLVGLSILSSIVDTGKNLESVHPALMWGFYLLVAAAIGWFGIRPLISVIMRKTRNWAPLLDPEAPVEEEWVQKQAKFLIRHARLDENDSRKLHYHLTFKKDLDVCMREIVNRKSEAMDKIIFSKSRVAFLAVAVSQNGPIDALILLGVNFGLVKKVIDEMGIRPSLTDLVKIYSMVAIGAIAVDQLSDLDFGDALPAVGTLAGKSAVQGIGAAAITLRVGYLAKAYLMLGDGEEHRKAARRWARIKLKNVVLSGMTELPKSIARKFESILPSIDFGKLVRMPSSAASSTSPKP